jgi:hypothetical protein
MAHTAKKKKLLGFFDDTPFESLAEVGSEIASSFKKDLVIDGVSDSLKQLSGKSEHENNKKGGELYEGEEIDLRTQNSSEHAPKPKHADVAPGLDYVRDILKVGEKQVSRENREIQQAVEQIMDEIKRLIETSTVLQAEFGYASVDAKPVEVGKYHINFFEWMLNVIKEARLKIEDSGAWLAAMGGKKNKRNYWAMFKKHGTSFGMSNERSVSTQTG